MIVEKFVLNGETFYLELSSNEITLFTGDNIKWVAFEFPIPIDLDNATIRKVVGKVVAFLRGMEARETIPLPSILNKLDSFVQKLTEDVALQTL